MLAYDSTDDLEKLSSHQIRILDSVMIFRTKTGLMLVMPLALSLFAAIFISACQQPEPTPTPTQVPPTPTEEVVLAPVNTATPQPELTPTSTVTATPSPVPTPATRETVSMYSAAHRTLDRGEFKDAERRFSTIVEIEPQFARAWAGRGQARMMQGELEDAMVDYDRAVSLRPNVGSIYGQRAMVRVSMGDFEGAKNDSLRALELDDEQINAHLVLGRVRAAENDYDAASEHFRTAISLAPEDGGVYWWRGRYHRDVLLDGNAAYADFSYAIELQPAQASYFLDRGILLARAGQYAEAKWDLEEAISLSQDPKLPTIIERAEEWLSNIEERAPGIEPVEPPPAPPPVN